MVAPVATPRVQPTGNYFRNGYRTLITLAIDTDLELWEKTVKPPGWDGGDPIESTTMWNDVNRTFSPQALLTQTPCNFTAAYLHTSFTGIRAAINVVTVVTVTFPNLATIAFYGYLRSADPGDNANGSPPEMSGVIQPTNQDPLTGEEEDPVVADPPAPPP